MKRPIVVGAAVAAASLALAVPALAWPAPYSSSGPYLSIGSGAGRRCAFYSHSTSHNAFGVTVSVATVATGGTSCDTEVATPAGSTLATAVVQRRQCDGSWATISSSGATNPSGRSLASSTAAHALSNVMINCGSGFVHLSYRTVSGHSVTLSGTDYAHLDVRPTFTHTP